MKEAGKFETTLNHIESSLQSLIEGSLARLFANGDPPNNLAHLLVEAMRENSWLDETGNLQAPNYYQLETDRAMAEILSSDPVMLDELANFLQISAQEAGIHFSGQPVVRLSMDPDLPAGEVHVTARSSQANLSDTYAMQIETPAVKPDSRQAGVEHIPPGAFLIVDGVRVFPLSQTLVNIGRHPDNHLVVDDPRVSRRHAQLRIIEGRFVIFDLNSTGGTAVNGKFIHQSRLSPGDVISLSGVPLVYGQEDIPPDSTQRVKLVV
jgi:hypothetical protein